MRKHGIENIDNLVSNLSDELTKYFMAPDYIVHFIAEPIPLKQCKINETKTIEGYIGNKINRHDGIKTIQIDRAKNTLKKLIKKNKGLNESRYNDISDVKRGLQRIDKMWQLISYYVSFHESQVYFYDGRSELGLFWSYALLLVDNDSDYAFFLGAGAWD